MCDAADVSGHIHRTTTITLAAHARQGFITMSSLISLIVGQVVRQCAAVQQAAVTAIITCAMRTCYHMLEFALQ